MTEPGEHISSFIVRCLPEKLELVMAKAELLPGVELHGRDEHGKFIALLEQESERALVQTIAQIEQLEGVLNASMVYHQID